LILTRKRDSPVSKSMNKLVTRPKSRAIEGSLFYYVLSKAVSTCFLLDKRL